MTPQQEIERDCDLLIEKAKASHMGWGRLHDDTLWVRLEGCRNYATRYLKRKHPPSVIEVLPPCSPEGWCLDLKLPTRDRLARYQGVS